MSVITHPPNSASQKYVGGLLAPPHLPRHERRRINRLMRKLINKNVCSICGKPFGSGVTAHGFDKQGNVAVVGECCTEQMGEIWGTGLGFELPPTDDQLRDTAKRYGGAPGAVHTVLDDLPWKRDDADWFEKNPTRAHRIRLEFPGEFNGQISAPPAGFVSIVVVRQLSPGFRLRSPLAHPKHFPIPEDEATAHALFDMDAQGKLGPNCGAELDALIEKYRLEGMPS